MEIVYILVPLSLMLVALAVVGYIWAVKSGQFDDCDTPQLRMLFDEESRIAAGKRDLKDLK
jgi:cbb3-type cytochrome oxidase maturation protein